MSEEAMLEQYPATLTEFAAPVDSDDETMAVVRPLLAQTRLQKLPLRCTFHLLCQEFSRCFEARRTPEYILVDTRIVLQGWPTQLHNMAGAAQRFMSKLTHLAQQSF